MKLYYVCIMTNQPHGTLYIGVTSNIERRMFEHKNKLLEGFTKQYHLDKLVYYEIFEEVHLALQREKSLKRWMRDWKIDLINKNNPKWDDLAINVLMDPRVRPEDDKVI